MFVLKLSGCAQVQHRRRWLAALLYVLLDVVTSARGVSGRPWPDAREHQSRKLASGQDVQAGFTSSTDGVFTTYTFLVSSRRRGHHIAPYVSLLNTWVRISLDLLCSLIARQNLRLN